MKKIIGFVFLFIYILSFSQIDVKIQTLEEKKKLKMLITLTNQTDEYYAVPFDKKGFKGYSTEEICSDLNSLDYPHSFFAPVLIFKDPQNDRVKESLIGNYHVGELNEKNAKKIKKQELKERARTLKWKDLNQFTNDLDAIRNLYLNENIVLLAPQEKVDIKLDMDVYNIRRGKTYSYNYYVLTNNKTYNLSIELCADKNIYNYLTEKQKKNLEKYKFFTGNLQSNVISYIYKN